MSAGLPSGTRVAERFEVLEVVAQGAMGPVHRARDEQDGGEVVLKLASPAIAALPGLAEGLAREADRAAAVHHPGLTDLVSWGEHDGTPWVASRWVPGTDLRDRLATGPPPPEDALALVEQVAAALDAVHAAGLVHGDVKATNVLVRETPAGPRAYLTDLGTAEALAQAGAAGALTGTAEVLGAPDALAPELAAGGAGATVGAGADRYNLACVAFEALTGTPPFTAPTVGALLVAHATRPRPRPSTRNPDLPVALDAVLTRALAIDPAERPASGAALVTALHAALGTGSGALEATGPLPDRTVVGALPSPPPAAARGTAPARRPRGRSRRARVLAGAAALTCIGAGVAAGLVLTHDEGKGGVDVPALPPVPPHFGETKDLVIGPAPPAGPEAKAAGANQFIEWARANQDPGDFSYDLAVAPQLRIEYPDAKGHCLRTAPSPTPAPADGKLGGRPGVRWLLSHANDGSLPLRLDGLTPARVRAHDPRRVSWTGTYGTKSGHRGTIRLWASRYGANTDWLLLYVDLCPKTKAETEAAA